jgi:DNA-binding response OmpR family regulator
LLSREGELQSGSLTLDLDGFAVFVDGRNVRLTLSEFILLKTLALQPYRVFDRAALHDAIVEVLPSEARPAPDLRLIDRHIARLRKKLHEAGCDCIETMRFTGYRFVPPA